MTFYDRKLVRMTAVPPKGDDVKLQLPVAAVKRLIDQAGKLPLPDDVVVRCTSCDVPLDVMTYTLPDSAELFPLLSIALI